jgi:dipeptidyl aminopeptidase/acylaminoacyl peptidase
MTVFSKTAFSLALAAALLPVPSRGQTQVDWAPMPNPDPRLAAMRQSGGARLRAPGQLAIAPDGSTLAWTLGGRGGGSLNLTDLTNPNPAKDKIVTVAGATSTDCSNVSPVWSPDSQTLAFTSTCTSKDDKPGQPQIFLYSRATGEAKQLTHVTGIFQQVAWAPDGKSLAFLFVENATRNAGALAAMKPWSGVIGEDGVEVQRVAAVDLSGGSLRYMTPSNVHTFEFDWAPDSHSIVFIAAPTPGENNWWVAKLYAVTAGMGSRESKASDQDECKGKLNCMPSARDTGLPHVVFDPVTSTTAMKGLQMAVPRFSPDGKKIAFIGGLMSDQGSTGGDIWVVDAKGGQPTDVTPNIDGTPTYISWTGNDTIGFTEERRGHMLLSDYTVSSKTRDAKLDLGETTVSGGAIKNAIAVSNQGTLAFVKSGHDTPPEIWVGPFAAPKQLTHLNDGAKNPTRSESVEWENEGFHVQGWLTYPKDYDPKKKYPLIVEVHGGPSASAGARWGQNMWSELGYFLFAPNPRGSFGQGEKFAAANYKDFGYGDLHDILAGMDYIETKVSIDKNREGLTGWSYGGFMTMFGVTQTTRFKAAVAGAGISDWQSYYGENSIDQWMVPFFGATVYDDPAAYAKSSAINFIKHVKTPTLVIVGDRDGECPAPQSFEFWHALKAEGVKTQLVVYPNEGHGFRDPAHTADRDAREVAWFEQNMPAK